LSRYRFYKATRLVDSGKVVAEVCHPASGSGSQGFCYFIDFISRTKSVYRHVSAIRDERSCNCQTNSACRSRYKSDFVFQRHRDVHLSTFPVIASDFIRYTPADMPGTSESTQPTVTTIHLTKRDH